MDCMSVGRSYLARGALAAGQHGLRAAAVTFLMAAGGFVVAAAPSRAMPAALPLGPLAAAPPILVRDYCGNGYHRENKHRNKAGAWVGKCVPNKPKIQQQPAGQTPGQPQALRRT